MQQGSVIDGVPFTLLRKTPHAPREGVRVAVPLLEGLNAQPGLRGVGAQRLQTREDFSHNSHFLL